MRQKKTFSGALTLTLTLTVFAGCGSSHKKNVANDVSEVLRRSVASNNEWMPFQNGMLLDMEKGNLSSVGQQMAYIPAEGESYISPESDKLTEKKRLRLNRRALIANYKKLKTLVVIESGKYFWINPEGYERVNDPVSIHLSLAASAWITADGVQEIQGKIHCDQLYFGPLELVRENPLNADDFSKTSQNIIFFKKKDSCNHFAFSYAKALSEPSTAKKHMEIVVSDLEGEDEVYFHVIKDRPSILKDNQ